MKLVTVLLAVLFLSLVLILFPLGFIWLNSFLSLPVYSFFLFKVPGMILIFCGAAIWLHCVYLFHFLGKGTPVPINAPKKLVVKGLYKYSRNPMYIGALLILFGYFMVLSHILLLLYLGLAAISFQLFIVLYEEPTLKKKFGKSYTEYSRKIPRWF